MFFFASGFGILENFAILRQYKQDAASVSRQRRSWHGTMKKSENKFGILENYSYLCINKTREHYA